MQRALSGVGWLVSIVTVETLFLSLHGPRSRALRNLLGLLEVRANAGNSGADGDSLVDRTISLLSILENHSWSLLVDISGSVSSSSGNELFPFGGLSKASCLLVLTIEEANVLGVGLNSAFVINCVRQGRNLSHVPLGIRLNCRNKISIDFVLREHISAPSFTRNVRLRHLVAIDTECFIPSHLEFHLISGAHSDTFSPINMHTLAQERIGSSGRLDRLVP